jgi:hypothetical protein
MQSINDFNYKRFLVKNGKEQLTFNGDKTGHKLIEFWRWISSDIMSNATRGKFAEFIVATAMNINLDWIREEWGECDLTTIDGDNLTKSIRIEVKSSAYLQTWEQNGYSKIIFSIKKRGATSVKTPKEKLNRPSDVYVFCLLNHKDEETVNPLSLNQWLFYVVSTKKIDEKFKDGSSISLQTLEKITSGVTYNELRDKIINEYRNN